MRLFLLAVSLFVSFVHGEKCDAPSKLEFELQPPLMERETLGFTQGLEFHDGVLYESTGAYKAKTKLNKISLDGKVQELKVQEGVFGEGLTIFKEQIHQITLTEGKLFKYDLAGRQIGAAVNYPRQGWGLANNGKRLISSDGSAYLAFHDPKNVNNFKTLQVRNHYGMPVKGLNELEFVRGKIFANVFGSDNIIRIHPETGCVEAVADMSGLSKHFSPEQWERIKADKNFVLNGIAFDESSENFFITGKNWPFIFKGKMKETSSAIIGGGSGACTGLACLKPSVHKANVRR